MHLMVCLAGYDNASETKKHDADAVRYLSYVLYPLLAGYAVYALFYETHKSWYSFILNTLVGAVYMFGFILMCPQVGPSLPPPPSSPPPLVSSVVSLALPSTHHHSFALRSAPLASHSCLCSCLASCLPVCLQPTITYVPLCVC